MLYCPSVETLGRYRLVRKIGSGGMAEVYLAHAFGAQGIDKQLVIKRILPAFVRDTHFITMFVDEAQVASRLNHSNIVQIYSFEQIGRDYVLAMEFVDGPDLTRLIVATRRKGRFIPAPLVAYVVNEVARGLDYAHNRRDEHGDTLEIVHRDVSPQNILLSYDGCAKIADFGIARARQLGEEGSGVIKGKFAYMSPEQASGAPVDRRSDIFSLGVVMFEMLAGRPLFRGKPGSQLLKAVKDAVIPSFTDIERAVPEPLEAIARRALARDPADRYQSARAMSNDLARYLHGLDEVVDATTLEAYLADATPRREGPSPQEAGPRCETVPEGALPTVAFQKGRRPRQTREKLNVVAVAGKLSGVETLTAAIGERRASARVRELMHIVDEIAFKAEGIVARQDEQGFLLYLGLPHSGVDDPLRAIRLGLDAIDAVEGLSYDLPSSLHLGLGINRGPARVEREAQGRVKDYEPYGLLATMAERLADDSGPGEIRVGGGVYRLSRRDINFEELPPLNVPVPSSSDSTHPDSQSDGVRRIRVFRLLGVKTRAQRRREAGVEGPLLGRDAELQRLHDIYREATSGAQARFVWIAGDMGIGKTRLINELLLRTETPSRRVIRADSTLASRELSYGAVADLVRDACGIGEDDRPEAVRTKLQVTAARLRPPAGSQEADDRTESSRMLAAFSLLLGQPLPDAPSPPRDGAERHGLIRDGVGSLLEGLARDGPLVVIIENIHFTDTSSLDLLRGLGSRRIERPILVVALGRPEENRGTSLADLERIVLRQLGEDDRLKLVIERLGDSDEARELARQICTRTGGNPFFISEVIESLIDRGVVSFAGAERKLVVDRKGPIRIPTSLEGVIASRIDELPSDERLLLRWAAVAGLTFTASMMAELAGGDVSAPLAGLVRRRILVEREAARPDERDPEGEESRSSSPGTTDPGKRRFAFRYPVMREVAYDGLVGSDRLQMHRRMANMLIARAGDRPGPLSARIAFHLERAGDQQAAAARYLEAAEVARAEYSNPDALRHFSRGLALLPADSPERFRAHEAREQILRGLGLRKEQMAELDEMRRIAQSMREPSLIALSYNRLARMHLDVGRLPQASKALAVALESARGAGNRGAEAEALRLLSVLARNEGQYLKAIDCCDQALTLLGTSADTLKQRGTILLARGDALQQMGRLQDAVQAYAEALVIYRRLGIKRLQSVTLNSMGQVARAIGEYEDAVGLLRRSLKLDQQINDRYRVGRKLCNLGLTYAEVGDVDRALHHLRRAAEVNHQLGDREGMEETLIGLAEVLLASGAAAEARETLDEAVKLAPEGGSRYWSVRAMLVRADIALETGALEDAASASHAAVEVAQQAAMVGGEIAGRVRLALTRARQGRTDDAAAVLERVDQLIGRVGEMERAETVYDTLGLALEAIGRTDAASAAFEKARRAVETRTGKMKSAQLRSMYLALPHVKRITERGRPGEATVKDGIDSDGEG